MQTTAYSMSEAQPVGEFADHALVHPRLAQRTKHGKLGNRHQSRAVIAVVVQIGRLRHVGDVVLLCNIPDLCEKLLLAEVAAVGRLWENPSICNSSDSTTICFMCSFSQNAFASLNSLSGKEQERAVTATAPSPSTSCATFNKNVESTPPENATTIFPFSRIDCFNASICSIVF